MKFPGNRPGLQLLLESSYGYSWKNSQMVVSPKTVDSLDACSTKYRLPFRLAIPPARSTPRYDRPACSRGSPLDDFYLHGRAYRDRKSVISAEFDRQDGYLPVFDNLRGESILSYPRHRLPPILFQGLPNCPCLFHRNTCPSGKILERRWTVSTQISAEQDLLSLLCRDFSLSWQPLIHPDEGHFFASIRAVTD